MIDEIGFAAVRGVGRIVGYIVVEFFVNFILYCIGRFFLLVITLGQYRRIFPVKSKDGFLEALVGFVVLMALFGFLMV